MRELTVREMRQGYQVLSEVLEKEGEVVLTHHGKPFARVLPIQAETRQSRLVQRSAELAQFRQTLPAQTVSAATLIREERDER